MAGRKNPTTATMTIAAGASTSDALDITNVLHAGFFIPSAFTGTAVSFTVCDTFDGTYMEVKTNANAAIAPTVNVSKAYPFRSEVMDFNFVKIVSNGTEAAARTILVSLKKE